MIGLMRDRPLLSELASSEKMCYSANIKGTKKGQKTSMASKKGCAIIVQTSREQRKAEKKFVQRSNNAVHTRCSDRVERINCCMHQVVEQGIDKQFSH